MKNTRQAKIIELIEKHDIETQDELCKRLKNAGFNVTQATVSRDIRDLKLIKVSTFFGRQKYSLAARNEKIFADKFIKVFKEAVVSIDSAQNIIVVKTLDGMAMAVAAALDSMDNEEIVGTIAGDNTIFCVVKKETLAQYLIEKLRVLL